MSECIRHTELPHTTRLFADLVYHFDRVGSFYHYAPSALESFQAAAELVRPDPDHRKTLVKALEAENRGAGAAAAKNLDRLAQPGTLVVASGQQVGLYGGPVFTIYKALSAARLAAWLSERGLPAAPVFWLATEDHDLEEINHVWVFNGANRPVRIEARADASPQQPVGSVAVSEPSGATLREALGALPFGDDIAELAAEAYGAGATFGSGFKHLLQRLLEPYGVLVIDPLAHSVRRMAAPVIRRAIQQAPQITPALLERGRRLEGAGYHVQVHVEEKTSLFFLMENGRRTPLRRSGDTYSANGATYSAADLLARLERSPEDFSPNALLRPVVQDFLLPTVAYVGGPAELAYLAQAEVLYGRLLGRMPVALPRACFTLLDARAQKLLSRYGLHVLDILQGPEAVELKIAAKLIPGPLHQAFAEGQHELQRALQLVENQLAAFDPTLLAALDKSRRKMHYQFSKIQAKAARESLRRAERAREESSYLQHLIFPEKTLQERLYSVLPFLARHGPGLIERLHQAVRFECPDHQVLVI
jgi:bacillithiol biosynthesis cysteine-adding enzyme BshC